MRICIALVVMMFFSLTAHSREELAAYPLPEDASLFLIGVGLSLGGTVFVLPGWPIDSVTPGSRTRWLDGFASAGPSLDYGVAVGASGLTQYPLIFELGGALTAASGEQISSQLLTGKGSLLLTGEAASAGTINLATGPVGGNIIADGTIHISDSTGDTVTINSTASSVIGTNAQISSFAYSQTNTGLAFIALTTDGTGAEAAAYGAIADDRGFSFIGVGDVDGSNITSSVRNTLFHTSHQLSVAVPISLNHGWAITPRIGPTYRHLGDAVDRITQIDIDEGGALSPKTPLISLSHRDELTSHYLGVIAGISISGPIASGWRFALGVEGGLAGFWTNYNGSSTTIFPGTRDINLPGQTGSLSGVTGLGGIKGSITHSLSNGTLITLTAHADYLADVPFLQNTQVNAPNASYTAGQSVAAFSSTAETYSTNAIGITSSWLLGARLSFARSF